MTDGEQVEWIKQGDIAEAKSAALDLGCFLIHLSQDKEAREFLMKRGIPWIGKDLAKFIGEQLLAKPSSTKGKNKSSGADLFAKVLVPNKTSGSQFEQWWLATFAHQNFHVFIDEAKYIKDRLESSEYEEKIKAFMDKACYKKSGKETLNRLVYVCLAHHLNNMVLENNAKKESRQRFSIVMPRRIVTPAKIEKAQRKYNKWIMEKKGIKKHKIER